ncbi:hypothetical protein JW872_03550 [Candidatus Babeliales bacterium]|nr:hypothetical protein [Candidatus Babeliales bacterium]
MKKNIKYIIPGLLFAASAQAGFADHARALGVTARELGVRALNSIPGAMVVASQRAIRKVSEEGHAEQGIYFKNRLTDGFAWQMQNADVEVQESSGVYTLKDGPSSEEYTLIIGDDISYTPWTRKSATIAGASVAVMFAGIIGLWNHYALVRAAKYEEEAAEYGIDAEDALLLPWELEAAE